MYNRVIIAGRITAPLELKQTPSGVSVCTFTVAVDRDFKTKDGEKQTDWIDIVAWRQTAEFICKYFSKGKAILIEGKIQTRSYTDKNNNKRKAVEVVADSAHFVESKQGGDNNAVQGNAAATQDAQPAHNSSADVGGDDFAEIDDSGDLPF